MFRIYGIAIVIALLWSANVEWAGGADWPHWRGPSRNGHTEESSNWTGGDWLSERPEWERNVGQGASSPLVFRDHVYVMGWGDENDTLSCLSLESGEVVWQRSYPCPSHGRFHLGDEPLYGGPSATPEIDTETGLLYSLSIDGDLKCWDLNKKGLPVWSHNIYAKYNVKQRPKLTRRFHRDYGYTASPLIVGDWLIVEVGSTEHGTYIAFNKKTGEEQWRSELRDEAGHTGGMSTTTVDGERVLVGHTQRNVAAVRLSGKPGVTLGTHEWITEGDCNIATPLAEGNSIVATSGYNQDAIARFEISSSGLKEIWRQPYSSKVCSPVLHDGSVYFSWMRVRRLDWETGEQKWEGGNYGDAGSCVIMGDGRLLVYGYDGKVGLIESAAKSPDEFKQLAVHDNIFSATAWPHVAVASGRLLCRDKDGNLACYRFSPAAED